VVFIFSPTEGESNGHQGIAGSNSDCPGSRASTASDDSHSAGIFYLGSPKGNRTGARWKRRKNIANVFSADTG